METSKVRVRTGPSRVRGPRPLPPEVVETFYRAHYRTLLKTAIYVGASVEEAEDAVEWAIVDVLDRGEEIEDPLAYARRAVVNNFIKQRTRQRRLIRRLIERAVYTSHDPGQEARLTLWEDKQWVQQLLDYLPPEQRKVMAFIVAGFKPAELAILFGKDSAAIRQTLMQARRKLRPALSEQRNSAGERRPDEHHR